MAVWDYQVILYPQDNKAIMTEEGIDFVGIHEFSFDQIVEQLVSTGKVKKGSVQRQWNSFAEDCYYIYKDRTNLIEIEINDGVKEEQVRTLSLRTNIYKPEGDIKSLITLAKMLSIELALSIWDMRLKSIVDKEDEESLQRTIQNYNSYKQRS
ncbi:hypothetical protein [Saccharibacillus qingshengii]|uniref:hypothetical protein n=1 Tax=Saccharibacillus qingshengii TaxID=1763540 RepID=UPI001557B133|nr:hypothetical protein [Saccharibacillus qingshengii]